MVEIMGLKLGWNDYEVTSHLYICIIGINLEELDDTTIGISTEEL